jgi:hypothetical protein
VPWQSMLLAVAGLGSVLSIDTRCNMSIEPNNGFGPRKSTLHEQVPLAATKRTMCSSESISLLVMDGRRVLNKLEVCLLVFPGSYDLRLCIHRDSSAPT